MARINSNVLSSRFLTQPARSALILSGFAAATCLTPQVLGQAPGQTEEAQAPAVSTSVPVEVPVEVEAWSDGL